MTFNTYNDLYKHNNQDTEQFQHPRTLLCVTSLKSHPLPFPNHWFDLCHYSSVSLRMSYKQNFTV